jgi:hypothetical protein
VTVLELAQLEISTYGVPKKYSKWFSVTLSFFLLPFIAEFSYKTDHMGS